jgi:TetR/AcrR family transcriptional repressor of nem operon
VKVVARPQAFNHQQVLSQAIECFWLKGYSETSLADLLLAMNISRSTFYNSFGDKRQLFELCLQTYGQQTQQILSMTLFSNRYSGMQTIRQFMHLVLLTPNEDLISRGCLLVNTIAETARVDSELNDMAKQLMQPVKSGFIQQLAREFNEVVSIQHGEWLFTQLLGWRLQTQMGMNKNTLQQQIDWSLSQLEQQLKNQQ